MSVTLTTDTLAQVEETKRLPSMADEIANLTRTQLGEGTINFENWIQFTVEERGRKRSGKLFMSDETDAFVWLDNINNDKSYFFKASDDSPILTLIPSIKQGTELSPAMMVALGYSNSESTPVHYSFVKGAPTETINDIICHKASTLFDGEEYLMFVGDETDVKRSEREMLLKGLTFWLRNQPHVPALSSAVIKEAWLPLGLKYEGYEFRVLDWGKDSEFTIIQDEYMINVPGLSLHQVAKEYVKNLEQEKEKEKEVKTEKGQNED
ncbi:MAG: hypothetical protein COA49_01745 [Bacteroidetes bacterium]|nr:MAG: hypothetical protein COA49_01745 [Bacteroidota bacterium]